MRPTIWMSGRTEFRNGCVQTPSSTHRAAIGASASTSRPFRSRTGPWPLWAGSFSTPKKTRRNSVSMYQAPNTTPHAASPASSQPGTSGRWNEYMPAIVSVSPTKPFRPGRPMLDMAMNTQNGQKLQPRRHAAVVGHLPRVVALVQHADQEEQAPVDRP